MVSKITLASVISIFITDYAGHYYLREIAASLKKPHQTIKPYLERLVRDNILIKDVRKGITEYSLNFREKRVYDYIIISEKEILLDRLSTDTLIKILYEKLSQFFEDNNFIIFGSAVDHMIKGSDIDILMVGDADITQVISGFNDVYNKKIHLIKIKSLHSLTSAIVKEIYKKHLIFNNTEEIVRFFGGLHEQHKMV